MRDTAEHGRRPSRLAYACLAASAATTTTTTATPPAPRDKTQTLDELLALLRRGIVAGGDVDQLLRLLARIASARAALVAVKPVPTHCYRCFNIPKEWIEIYTTRIADLDPLLPVLDHAQPMSSRPGPGRWHSARSLMTIQELKQTGIWQVARSLGIGDVAAVNLWSPLCGSIYLAVLGALQRGPFTRTALTLLDLLSPHLAAALASRRALAAITEPASEQLPEALERVDGHALLHPSSGQVELCPRARKLLQKHLGHLKATDWPKVENMLLAAAHRFCCWPLSLSSRSQRLIAGLRVELVLTHPAESTSPDIERTITALLLDEPVPEAESKAKATAATRSARSREATTPLEELLTPRQRQVARAAAAGKTTAEIASKLGIHIETARTHLKKAYRKLGISKRSELGSYLDPGARS
jgi:DNA-binding CsgD family transcriptional regulator